MPEDLRFVAHPPERGRRSTTLLASGCCCCCCCCFHSVGSLAGALYGMRGTLGKPAPGLSPEDAVRIQGELKAAGKFAIKIYWKALVVVAIITTLVSIAFEPNRALQQVGVGGLIILGFMPAGQLMSSLLALIYINVFPPAQKPEALRRLGRITLFSFLWGCIGAVITGAVLAGILH
jgi:hypothetical protein